MNKIYQPIIYALLLIIGIQFGFKFYEMFHRNGGTTATNSSQNTINSINEIVHLVNAKYVDPVDNEELKNNIIENTIKELDPHSTYIPVKELQTINEELEGNFEGIGIEFSILRDTILVVTSISGGPSEAVGILPGDKIVAVDDSIVASIGLKNKDVVNLLRGKKGTKVKATVYRNGLDELLEFNITRDKIPLTSVDVAYMIDDKTGYLKINRFSATTYNEFGKNMLGLIDQGMEKLILDLRGNPGGYLDAAYRMADEFIAGKEILVYTQGKNYKRKDYISKVRGIFEKGNLAILIDEGSASASEILAGCVQDLDRGVIIGRRSFGKGLVQEQVELTDGSAMRITIARYYTPSGRSIQKPYEIGETDNYNDDLENRYEHGELFSQDSIAVNDSLKYYTRSGRLVYGGGGIVPDVFVPIDTTQTMEFFRIRSYVPEFVYSYFSTHQNDFVGLKGSTPKPDKINVNNSLYKEFKDYCRNKEIKAADVDFMVNKNELVHYIEAYIARQIWGNDGFFPIINEIDRTVLKSKEILEDNKLFSEQLSVK